MQETNKNSCIYGGVVREDEDLGENETLLFLSLFGFMTHTALL